MGKAMPMPPPMPEVAASARELGLGHRCDAHTEWLKSRPFKDCDGCGAPKRIGDACNYCGAGE